MISVKFEVVKNSSALKLFFLVVEVVVVVVADGCVKVVVLKIKTIMSASKIL